MCDQNPNSSTFLVFLQIIFPCQLTFLVLPFLFNQFPSQLFPLQLFTSINFPHQSTFQSTFYVFSSTYCQARVQVQGLSQISNKRPGPGACSYNCIVSTTTQQTFLSTITLKSLHEHHTSNCISHYYFLYIP